MNRVVNINNVQDVLKDTYWDINIPIREIALPTFKQRTKRTRQPAATAGDAEQSTEPSSKLVITTQNIPSDPITEQDIGSSNPPETKT